MNRTPSTKTGKKERETDRQTDNRMQVCMININHVMSWYIEAYVARPTWLS